VKITDNVSFGAEYLYTNLGNGDSAATFTTGPFTGGVAGGTTDFSTNDDFDFHTVTAKLSYRFN
jgi:outer membrane immunogenic protein